MINHALRMRIPTWLQVTVCSAHLTQPCCDFYKYKAVYFQTYLVL